VSALRLRLLAGDSETNRARELDHAAAEPVAQREAPKAMPSGATCKSRAASGCCKARATAAEVIYRSGDQKPRETDSTLMAAPRRRHAVTTVL
jgi:hypothetical protein